MPQGLTVPAWYNDDHYISEKVDECNTIKFGDKSDWNADSVKAALASAFDAETYAPWMGYDNFVSNGNAENCSPSPYFVVSEYLAAKAAQLNEIEYQDKTDWTQADVLDAFKTANISAWDHYTTNGQAEGINPSNAFDNDAFFTAKCAILNAWQNEDGTVGYEGKDDWTKDDVVARFQDLKINPIVNQPENPDAASLIIEVPAGEQVNGGNFNPWSPTGPTEYNDIPLVAGEHEYIGTAGNDNFIGDITASSSKSTLQRDDVIDGKGGDDMLTVDMNASWSGFSSKGGMTGVGTVNLNNDTARTFNFDTKGIEGATTYNLDGNVNLSGLAETGIDVNLANVHATNGITLGFASGVTSGPADALTIGLENVYVPSTTNDQPSTPVSIKAQGIEDITINSTGKLADNNVDLSNVNYMESLTVTGDGNLRAQTTGTFLTEINASDATGNVRLIATGNALDNIQLGSGNDIVTNNVTPGAIVDGGDGNDKLIIDGANGSYALATTNLETIGIKNNVGDVTLIGTEMDGVETLELDGTANVGARGIVLGEFTNSQLNVQVDHANTANVTIADISDIVFTVGDGFRGQPDSYRGTLTLDASTLALIADDGVTNQGATFRGVVNADDVTDLTLTAGRNSSVDVTGGDLQDVSNIIATGYGAIELEQNAHLADSAQSVYVDTTQMRDGLFTATFDNNSTNPAQGTSFTLVGSNIAGHNISIDSTYDSISLQTGMGNDKIYIDATGAANNSIQLTGNLGGGNNAVFVYGNVNAINTDNWDGPALTNALAQTEVQIGGGTYSFTADDGQKLNFTEAGGVANVTMPNSGAEIKISSNAVDVSANVNCGDGVDKIGVSLPQVTDGTGNGFLTVVTEGFDKTSDKIVIDAAHIGAIPGHWYPGFDGSSISAAQIPDKAYVMQRFEMANISNVNENSIAFVQESSVSAVNDFTRHAVTYSDTSGNEYTAIVMGQDELGGTMVVLSGVLTLTELNNAVDGYSF